MDEVLISGEVICAVVCFEAGKQIKLLGQMTYEWKIPSPLVSALEFCF